MKFVYDPKLGTMVPENYLKEKTPPPIWRKDLEQWLTKDKAKEQGYSTRSIAYAFKADFPKYKDIDIEELRTEIAKRNNDILANEDMMGGPAAPAGGVGAGLTSTGAINAISNPVIKRKRQIKEGSSESNKMISPQKNRKMPIVGADLVTGAGESDNGREPTGHCFREAYDTFFSKALEGPLLVHGVVTGQGKIEGIKYVHAWVEIGDTVIDTTIPLFEKGFPRGAYYNLARADEKDMFKYNEKQVLEKALEYKTYGPWEDELWNIDNKNND